jgi:hypothetical protein
VRLTEEQKAAFKALTLPLLKSLSDGVNRAAKALAAKVAEMETK